MDRKVTNMNRPALIKDASIHQVLRALSETLGGDSFAIADHWDGDLCAIGVGAKSDHRRLVYICTYEKDEGRFDYECEYPPGESGDTSMHVDVDFGVLADAVRRHLLRR